MQQSAVHGPPETEHTMTQSGPPNTPKAKDAALLTLMERSGYNIVQENGQRKFGPPPDWTGNPPPKGCEVFVGKLPRDLYEDELVPVFEELGKIYEVRLMMDFSGSNRGFAFVMYTCADDAKRAVKELDNYEIRKGRFIGVCKSVDNCRLFVGGIPKTKTKEEILEEMKKITDYVSDVILYSSMTDKTKNRGFAFVEYENHRAAAMARRKLIPGKIQIWGHDIAVDWAEPEPEVDETIMSKVTILYVRNLMMTTTEDHLKDVFSLNDTVKVEKVKKLRDFAFVHYRSREDAEAALAELNDTEVDNSIIEVTWAKPVDRTTRQRSRSGTGQPLPAYNPYMYSSGLDVYSGAIPTITPCPSSCPVPTNISARGRGRGAAGVRRLRNYGRGSSVSGTYKPVEARLVELLPNMELIPTNPYTLRPARRPLQVLMDICQKNSWGEPIFQLHSTAHDSNENSQLFVYKVTIPSLPAQYNQFQPNKLSRMPEEAKQYAAEYVLMQLGLPFDGVEPSLAVTASGIPGYGGHPRLGPPSYLHPSAAYDAPGFYEMIPPPQLY